MGKWLILAGILALQEAVVSERQYSGDVIAHTVSAGESLVSLGARFGVEPRTLATDNGLAAVTAISAGQRLVIDNRHVVPKHPAGGIVINVPQRMLFVFVDDRLVAAYPVAVGRPDWRTPLGEFVVSNKETDPTWDVPASIQEEMSARGGRIPPHVPPGPNNPLGDRWIGVSGLGFGIHGTNQPSSIYRFATHGCIRLHPDDARSLFDVVWIGMPIQIVYQPILAARLDPNHVMVEVHADVYRRAGAPEVKIADLMRELSVDVADLKALHEVLRHKHGRGIVLECRARHLTPAETEQPVSD